MSERRYSVKELDALRRVVGDKWLWGRYSGPVYDANGMGQMSRSYRGEEKAAAVEEMVRTHMLAGHTAEELLASEKPTPTVPGLDTE